MKPNKLPKQEDVQEFDMGNMRAILVRVTEYNAEYLTEVSLSMYLGEKCKYCLREYKTLDDLRQTVFAGYHEHGRLACKSCWNDHNP